MDTKYVIFFKTHQRPAGWKQELDHLLYYFFMTYEKPGAMETYILPQMKALVEDRPHPELPDDWGYIWGKVLPRRDFVWLIDKSEMDLPDWRSDNSYEGSALLDETSVELKCTKYLKVPTIHLLKLCLEWDDFLTTDTK